MDNYKYWESGRVDIVKTRADLLHRHAVRLGSLNIVEVSTIEKLRDIVDHSGFVVNGGVLSLLPD